MTRDELYAKLLTQYGQAELERVRVLIGSRTLREALRLVVDAQAGLAELFIPHYWAVYYHDGRGPVHPILAQKLVFFADSRDDPRLAGGYPVRDTDIRSLTRQEYEEGLAINAERRAAGQGPFMFVVDSVGPTRPRPFFDQLANNAAGRMDLPARIAVDEFVQSLVDEVGPDRGTATFVI